MRSVYLPGASFAAGKLNLPSAPLTTLTVTGVPEWRALTTTPSRAPSGETTRPASSARAIDVTQSMRSRKRIGTVDLLCTKSYTKGSRKRYVCRRPATTPLADWPIVTFTRSEYCYRCEKDLPPRLGIARSVGLLRAAAAVEGDVGSHGGWLEKLPGRAEHVR